MKEIGKKQALTLLSHNCFSLGPNAGSYLNQVIYMCLVLLAWLTSRPWRRRRYILPILRWTSVRLYSFTSQMIVCLIVTAFRSQKKIVNVINNTPDAHLTVFANLCNFRGPVLKECSTVSANVGRTRLLVLFCSSLAPESWNNRIKPWSWPLALRQVHKLRVTENRVKGSVTSTLN
jgi:hypothetical protein